MFTIAFAASAAAQSEEAAWAALAQGGHVIVMRHADAPGPEQGREGDPPGFRLDDCSTQRNLDDFGREEAKEIGNMIRAHRIVVAKIMSSPWCRARDTAELMNLGVPVEINNLLHNTGARLNLQGMHLPPLPQIVREMGDIIEAWPGPGNMLLVTHGRTAVGLVWHDMHMRSPEQGALLVLHPEPGTPQRYRFIGAIPAPR